MSTISSSTTTTTAYKVTADTTGALVLQTGATPTTAVTIDTSQNVGIGTSSPTKKLSVVGSGNDTTSGAINTVNSNAGATVQTGLYVSNGTQSTQFSLAGTGYSGYGAYTAGNAFIYNDQAITLMADNGSTGIIKFATGGNGERARIDSSGNLLVGTTSAISSTNGSGIHVAGSNGHQIVVRNTSATSGNWWRNAVDSANTYYVLNHNTAGVSIANGATSWSAVSDENAKDIIEPISNATEKVSSLRAVIGKYKTDEEGTRRSFLIAQDVQAVLPEAVSEDLEGVLSLRYTETIPLLVAAIQELKAELDAAKADIATLKGAA